MTKNIKHILIFMSLICSLFLLTGLHTKAIAASITAVSSSPNATQLAWGYGWGPRYPRYRGYNMYVPGPRYKNHGVYWTGWYRIAPRCQKRCLINGWGETIRCVRRCW